MKTTRKTKKPEREVRQDGKRVLLLGGVKLLPLFDEALQVKGGVAIVAELPEGGTVLVFRTRKQAGAFVDREFANTQIDEAWIDDIGATYTSDGISGIGAGLE
jgi:hypothetical protein